VPHAVVAGVLLVATTPVWAGGARFLWDAFDQFFPAFSFAAAELRAGRLPTWDPYTACGLPFDAEPQYALALNPLAAVLALLVRPPSVAFLLVWYAIWLGGALGAARLARVLGADAPGAAFAGIAFGLSGYFVGHASHVPFLVVAAAFPWAIALAHQAVAERRLSLAVLSGAALATATWGGYPGLVIFAGLALAGWLAVAHLPGGADGLRERAGWVALVAAIAGAIAVVVWTPTLYSFFRGAAGYTERTGALDRAFAIDNGALTLGAAASVFFPYLNVAARPLLAADITMNDAFVGALTIPLAAAWLAREPRRRAWLGIGVVLAFLLTLGSAGLVRGLLYDLVPPTRFTRHTGALRVFWLLPLCAAAGAAVSSFRGDERLRRLARATTLGWAAAAALSAVAVARWLGAGRIDAGAHAVSLFLPAAAGLLVGLALVWSAARLGPAAGWALVAAVALDQAWHVRANGAMTAWARTGQVIDQIERAPPSNAPHGARSGPLLGFTNVQQILRYPTVEGYVALSSGGFDALVKAPYRSVLAEHRFWIAPGAVPPAQAATARAALPQASAHAPVPLVADDPSPPYAEPARPGSYGAVRIVRFELDRVELDVDVPPAGGWLASSERFSAQWRAAVDAEPVPMGRVNLAFRGHPVPPGRHRVTWTYDTGLRAPLVVLAWVVFAGACALGGWLARRDRRARTD
jgi:hypothetical protein